VSDASAATADSGAHVPEGVRRIARSTRTPGDLRPRRPLGDGVRSARAFAFDMALPTGARTDGPAVGPAVLPDGVLPTGRGVAPEQPAMPQTGALAAYAALLARKVKPPRDVPVRGLPLLVRRPAHADAGSLRLPGSIIASLIVEDAKVAPNAARAPRRVQRPAPPGGPGAPGGAPQPAPAVQQPQPARAPAPRRADPRAARSQNR
jgi:hypothetical protein